MPLDGESNVVRPAWPARQGVDYRAKSLEFWQRSADLARGIEIMTQASVHELPRLTQRHNALILRMIENQLLAEGFCTLAQHYGRQAAALEAGL